MAGASIGLYASRVKASKAFRVACDLRSLGDGEAGVGVSAC